MRYPVAKTQSGGTQPVTAAALVVRFCFEACLTRGMVCILRKFCLRWQMCARQIRRARVACA